MPSSTSSFDAPSHRAPPKKWRKFWALCIVGALAMVFIAEVFWRGRSFRPSVSDSPALWAYHRAKVTGNREKSVVLLGNSRMEVGFSMNVFRNRFPKYQLSQLAVNGKYPVAILRDLANEEEFRGIVICATKAPGFHRDRWDEQQEYVDFFHARYGPQVAIDSVIGSWLQSCLVTLNPAIRIDHVLRRAYATGGILLPYHVQMHADRSQPADYTLIDLKPHRDRRIQLERKRSQMPFPSPDVWMEDVAAVEELVERIQNRGGHVVFVRFPTTDEHWQFDEYQHPKEKYWDRMAAQTSAETIHFKDVAALADFKCPDTSHIDCRDSPKFTNNLLQELVDRGILVDD